MKYRSLLIYPLLFLVVSMLANTIPLPLSSGLTADIVTDCSCEGEEFRICAGDELTLSCGSIENCADLCTRWSPELYLTEESDVSQLSITVVPEVSTTYTFYVTDEAGEIIQTIEFPVIVGEPFEASIDASSPVLCNGNDVTLKGMPEGDNYEYDWADLDAMPEPRKRTINTPANYMLTVTNTDTNCSDEVALEIQDAENTPTEDAMLDYFRSKGFLEFEITIIDEEGLVQPGGPQLKNGNVRDEFEGEILFDANDDTPVDVAGAINGALSLIGEGQGYVTINESFCAPGAEANQTLIEEINLDFAEQTYSYWVHLWENPEEGKDVFLIKAQTFTHEDPTPDSGLMEGYIKDLVEEVSGESTTYSFNSKSDQEVAIILDQLSDFYDEPLEERIESVNNYEEDPLAGALRGEPAFGCEGYELPNVDGQNLYYLNVAGNTITLPEGSAPYFNYAHSKNYKHDLRAVTGFITPAAGENPFPQKWSSYGFPEGNHVGFKRAKDPADYRDFPAIPETLICRGSGNLRWGPLYVMGNFEVQDDGCINYSLNGYFFQPRETGPLEEGERDGPPVEHFDDIGEGSFCQDTPTSQTTLAGQICIPALKASHFSEENQSGAFNPFGKGGILYKLDINSELAGVEYVYGRFEGNPSDPDEGMVYYWWNCPAGWVKVEIEEELTIIRPPFSSLRNLYKWTFGGWPSLYELGQQVTDNISGHTALEVAAFIPIIGTPADIANALWYLVEGEYGEATFALIGVLPFVDVATATGRRLGFIQDGAEAALSLDGKIYRARASIKFKCTSGLALDNGFRTRILAPSLLTYSAPPCLVNEKEFLIVIEGIVKQAESKFPNIPMGHYDELWTFLALTFDEGEALSRLMNSDEGVELFRTWSRTLEEGIGFDDIQRGELFSWIMRSQDEVLAAFTDPARGNMAKAWKGLYQHPRLRNDISWLERVAAWFDEGAELVEEGGSTWLKKNGINILEIRNNKVLPDVNKYDYPISNGIPVGTPANGYQLVKNGDNLTVRRVPEISGYTQTELNFLKPNSDAHVLERHGHDVTDDALIRRATGEGSPTPSQGYAPDGSLENKPPFASKFHNREVISEAIEAVKPGSPSFNLGEFNSRGNWEVDHPGDFGYGFNGSPARVQMRKVTAIYREVTPGVFELITMFPNK